jgi:hypothetical protein
MFRQWDLSIPFSKLHTSHRQAEEIRDRFARYGARNVAANRVKDRESLDRLRSFRDYWKQQRRP